MSDQNKLKTIGMGSGMAPLAETREQSIADSVTRSQPFQKLYPDVDIKAALIEPTINFTFDIQVTLLIIFRIKCSNIRIGKSRQSRQDEIRNALGPAA